MIEFIILLSGVKKIDLAAQLGFKSRVTLDSRLERPGEFTIDETRLLSLALEIPQEELVEIICGSRRTYNAVVERLKKLRRV